MPLVIEATTRETLGKQNKKTRSDGALPGVLYGKVKENANLQVNTRDFAKVYEEAGESTIVDLKLNNGDPVKVLIQDVQRDPVKQTFLHVDFFAIDINQKLTTEVDLKFIGESKAVKELGGIFVKNHDSVEIECLPGDLVHEIVVDISSLQTFEDRYTIGDIKAPKGITFTHDADEVLASVEEPRSEKELEALDEKIEGKIEEVEVEEKGKKEENEEGEVEPQKEAGDTKKEDKK